MFSLNTFLRLDIQKKSKTVFLYLEIKYNLQTSNSCIYKPTRIQLNLVELIKGLGENIVQNLILCKFYFISFKIFPRNVLRFAYKHNTIKNI
jgi:hypothetical protein